MKMTFHHHCHKNSLYYCCCWSIFRYAKIDPKSELKIEVWAIRGQTFEVLRGFLRSLIFDEFSIGEKSAWNRQSWRRGAAKGESPGNFSEGRRAGRWPQEAFGVWQELARSDNASRTPCTPKGGGGFKGFRPTRRPNKWKVLNLPKQIIKYITLLKDSRTTISVMLINLFLT